VRSLKIDLLGKSFLNFSRRAREDIAYSTDFDAFCATEREWLVDYAFFLALLEENGYSERWDEWREEHRNLDSAREWIAAQPQKKHAQFGERARFYRYVQWIAHS